MRSMRVSTCEVTISRLKRGLLVDRFAAHEGSGRALILLTRAPLYWQFR